MKLRFILFSISIILLFTSNSILFSQTAEDEESPIFTKSEYGVFYVGPVAGYNKSMHTVNLSSFAEDPLCPFFSDGDDNGFYFGGVVQFPFAKVNSQHSIYIKALYSTLPSYFEVATDDNYPSLIEIEGGGTSVEYTSTVNQLKVEYSMVSIELLYGFTPVPSVPFSIVVGPTLDFAFKKNFTQKFVLLADPSIRFKKTQELLDKGYKYIDNDRTIIVDEGDIENSNSFRLGLKFGAEFNLSIPGLGILAPHAFYNFGVTKLASEDWRVNALQIGVDLRFALSDAILPWNY
jgi:hypothetical protein